MANKHEIQKDFYSNMKKWKKSLEVNIESSHKDYKIQKGFTNSIEKDREE